MAAVHPSYAVGGAYIYNDERFDKQQLEQQVWSTGQSHDPDIGAKVWALSEKAVNEAGFAF